VPPHIPPPTPSMHALVHTRERKRKSDLRYPRESALVTVPSSKRNGLERWFRDLTEEGIEPHPGPRIISKNINGISDDAHRLRVLRNLK
jgi:hypothetical protein